MEAPATHHHHTNHQPHHCTTRAAQGAATEAETHSAPTTGTGKLSDPCNIPGAGPGIRAVKGNLHTGGEGEDGGAAGEEQKEVHSALGKPTTPASQATCANFPTGGRQQTPVQINTTGGDIGGRQSDRGHRARGARTVHQPGTATPGHEHGEGRLVSRPRSIVGGAAGGGV